MDLKVEVMYLNRESASNMGTLAPRVRMQLHAGRVRSRNH